MGSTRIRGSPNHYLHKTRPTISAQERAELQSPQLVSRKPSLGYCQNRPLEPSLEKLMGTCACLILVPDICPRAGSGQLLLASSSPQNVVLCSPFLPAKQIEMLDLESPHDFSTPHLDNRWKFAVRRSWLQPPTFCIWDLEADGTFIHLRDQILLFLGVWALVGWWRWNFWKEPHELSLVQQQEPIAVQKLPGRLWMPSCLPGKTACVGLQPYFFHSWNKYATSHFSTRCQAKAV